MLEAGYSEWRALKAWQCMATKDNRSFDPGQISILATPPKALAARRHSQAIESQIVRASVGQLQMSL